jgi:hypothetical protein
MMLTKAKLLKLKKAWRDNTADVEVGPLLEHIAALEAALAEARVQIAVDAIANETVRNASMDVLMDLQRERAAAEERARVAEADRDRAQAAFVESQAIIKDRDAEIEAAWEAANIASSGPIVLFIETTDDGRIHHVGLADDDNDPCDREVHAQAIIERNNANVDRAEKAEAEVTRLRRESAEAFAEWSEYQHENRNRWGESHSEWVARWRAALAAKNGETEWNL